MAACPDSHSANQCCYLLNQALAHSQQETLKHSYTGGIPTPSLEQVMVGNTPGLALLSSEHRFFHFILVRAMGNVYGTLEANEAHIYAQQGVLLPELSAWELRLRENKGGSSMKTVT